MLINSLETAIQLSSLLLNYQCTRRVDGDVLGLKVKCKIREIEDVEDLIFAAYVILYYF